MRKTAIKAGDKIILTEDERIIINPMTNQEDAARTLATFAGELLNKTNTELFKTLETLYPELKDWIFTYNKAENALMVRHKKTID